MSDQEALTMLQEKFCISKIGGDIRVLDRDEIAGVKSGKREASVAYYKKFDGEMLMKRYLESLTISHKTSTVINAFWVHDSTMMFAETAFTPKATPKTTLNYWSGHTAKPIKGDYDLIGDFLFDVICSGDRTSYHYLVKFLAHMLQKPEDKPGVVPVLIGQQGTGKGVFFQLLRSIWSCTTLLVNDIDGVIGRFNSGLERSYIICMDEALFSGDKKSMDRLKSLVTEQVIRIEEKYQPARSIDSCHRFFAASNHDHFGNIELDDRRFFFLRVSSCHQKDYEYFTQLCNSFIDGKTVQAFVYYLLSVILDDFNVRDRPRTEEHEKQKIKSLKGVERYWFEVLSAGDFVLNESIYSIPSPWKEPFFKDTNSLIKNYKDFDKHSGKYEPIQAGTIISGIKKMCPSATSKAKRLSSESLVKAQKRGLDLPSLETARNEFEDHIGSEIDWDE